MYDTDTLDKLCSLQDVGEVVTEEKIELSKIESMSNRLSKLIIKQKELECIAKLPEAFKEFEKPTDNTTSSYQVAKEIIICKEYVKIAGLKLGKEFRDQIVGILINGVLHKLDEWEAHMAVNQVKEAE